MFERYSEKARRVIFFARAEASEFGSPSIESEHLLLAIFHDKGILHPFMDEAASEGEIRAALAKHVVRRPPSSTSVDLPLSNECKQILYFSADEADRQSAQGIGPEHLLAGILREENCLAAQLLRERGLTLERARAALAATETPVVPGGPALPAAASSTDVPTNQPTTINVVDADTSELLHSYQHSSLIPQIGHIILISKEGRPHGSYQVSDVVWDFDSSLKCVHVSAHKGPTQGGWPVFATPKKFKQRPILSVVMDVKTQEEQQQLQKILSELAAHDSTVSLRPGSNSTQTILAGMDEWHLERICEGIVRDHHVKPDVGPITVVYLETVREPAEAEGKYIRQLGGVGNYGHVKIRIEPDEADFEFVTDIKGGEIPQKYFYPIEQGVRDALSGGVLAGHELVNVRVTLFDGSYHDFDSNPVAFSIAGAMAAREAARKASPVLLEPMMAIEVAMPEELLASTLEEIRSRRGRVESIGRRVHLQSVQAIVPLAETLGPDRPVWSMRFAGYEPAPLRGGLGGTAASVTQPRRPTTGSGSSNANPEREFEG
jgi:Elongation factor G, domain IV/Elongation Factor G, domain III/Elongation factor G C-terminus/Clp amino terminal domain, pathogenicity island component